jgi:hypothetical protein
MLKFPSPAIQFAAHPDEQKGTAKRERRSYSSSIDRRPPRLIINNTHASLKANLTVAGPTAFVRSSEHCSSDPSQIRKKKEKVSRRAIASQCMFH